MLNFDPTEITAEEQAAVLANSTARTVTPAPEGYVKCTHIAKALNEALVKAGFEDRKIPSQMVYNYAKKGVGGLKTDSYPHVPEDVALAWIRKQFIVRTAVEQLEDELEAEENEANEDETVLTES